MHAVTGAEGLVRGLAPLDMSAAQTFELASRLDADHAHLAFGTFRTRLRFGFIHRGFHMFRLSKKPKPDLALAALRRNP